MDDRNRDDRNRGDRNRGDRSYGPAGGSPAAEPQADNKFTVDHLHVFYRGRLALRDVSIGIGRNRITALIGPSGCGKSTFLRCLNRMNDTIPGARVTGRILLDGEDILDPGTNVVELRRRVGMVFQRPNPFPQSIFDNVAFGPRVLGTVRGAALADLVERSLRSADLWEEVKDGLDGEAQALSLGQQQRLCIARAVAVSPEVILMDEPCSALDPISTLRIEELMRQLAETYTIVIVTHNMQQAARVSDETGFFWIGEDQAGLLAEFGPTSRIFTSPNDRRTEDYITGRSG